MSDLVQSVEAAVKAMNWLTDADNAAVDLALSYARAIDEAEPRGGLEYTKALYLGPHLLNTLKALGGTPEGRQSLTGQETVKGKLAQMRLVKGGKSDAAKGEAG